MPCFSLQHRFGVLWQIHPGELDGMRTDSDEGWSLRVLHAICWMEKADALAVRDDFVGG